MTSAEKQIRLIGWCRVGVLLVIHKHVMVVLTTCVALALNGVVFLHELHIRQPPELYVVGHLVLGIVLVRINVLSSFQQQNVQTLLGQFLGCPAARNSRTNNDCVVGFGSHLPVDLANKTLWMLIPAKEGID